MGSPLAGDACRDIPLVVKYDGLSLFREAGPTLGVGKTGIVVALALYEAALLQQSVSYSRSRSYYDSRQCHPLLTFRKTKAAMDALDAGGWIEHFRQRPGGRGMQSAAVATAQLVGFIGDLIAAKGGRLPLVLPRHPIELRDAVGCPTQLPNSRAVSRMAREVNAINEALAATNVRGANDNNLSATVVRIFNRDLRRGGRICAQGASWQNERSALRRRIQIDGEQVVELDFCTLHPAILYAEAGAPLPADCYTVEGWPRALVKVAFLILINSRNIHQARLALAHDKEMQFWATDQQDALRQASRLIADLKRTHKPIAKAFHSDAGARLMRIDSDIARDVMMDLLRQGIVALPVHDSFLVPVGKRDQLETAMLEAAHRAGLKEIRVTAAKCDVTA